MTGVNKPLTMIKGLGLTKPGRFPCEEISYEPHLMRPTDVDIKIVACGICGADPHFTRGDWGGPHFPIIPGHEIIGYVVAKGDEVDDNDIKIGDRVGVGAACDSCNDCYRCKHDHENNCRFSVLTYGNHTAMPTRQGGYASHIRVNSMFAFKIPDNIDSEHAAPLLCGGMTSLSPMLINNVNSNTKVAICGIGGIGHMSIMFGKALGAHVTAISSSDKKKDLALKLGADAYISMADTNFISKNLDAFDLIIHTGAYVTNKIISDLIQLLRPNGNLQLITGPDLNDGDLKLNVFDLVGNNVKIGGVASGSLSQIKYMLKLASENNIKPMIETVKFNQENIESAWTRLDNNDVKFRFVLTDYDEYFD